MSARALSEGDLDELERLLGEATPGPWVQDDCNIFSKRLGDARMQAVMAKIAKEPYDENALHLDAFIASTEQRHEQSDTDADLIVALRNAGALLVAEVRAARAARGPRL